jgi:hypothetical protein
MKKLLLALLLVTASARIVAQATEPTLWEKAVGWYNQGQQYMQDNPGIVKTAQEKARQLAIQAGLVTPTPEDQLVAAANQNR